MGNAAGDVLFTCIDLLLDAPPSMDHTYAWISQWTIEMARCSFLPSPSSLATNLLKVGESVHWGGGTLEYVILDKTVAS